MRGTTEKAGAKRIQAKHVTDEIVVQHVKANWARLQDWNGESHLKMHDETIPEETGCCEKVAFIALLRACDRGLIEYGGNVRSAWPTQEGLAFLEACELARVCTEPAAQSNPQGRL